MLSGAGAIDANLILTGYLGPSQPLIARRVAERLRLPYVDFERRLEDRAGLTGRELRETFGEQHLKAMEADLVSEMLLYRGTVIHISGGTLMRGSNLASLAATGPVLCVVASIDTVLSRLHLSLGARFHDPRERAVAVGTLRREWAVRGAPGVVEVDTSALNEGEMIEAIAAAWREQARVIDWRGI